MTQLYAVIPTRDRPTLARDAAESVLLDVDAVVIVDNGSAPPVEPWHPQVHVIRVPCDPPNISALWNAGLDWVSAAARGLGHERWSVAVLNDDVRCPPGWVPRLDRWLRDSTAVLVYPDQHNRVRSPVLHTAPGGDIYERICGYAFMLRGETEMRADESMAWWYSDDDLDWRARAAGGALLVPGYAMAVEHRHPNALTNANPELLAQTAADRATFEAKWKCPPW